MEVARLTAVIDANTSGFTRAMRGVNGNLGVTARRMDGLDGSIVNTNKRMGMMGGVLRTTAIGFAAAGAAGVAAIGIGMGLAIRTGIGELKDYQTNVANTEAGLKSTKGVANVTRKSIEDLSASIERKTGIDGDQVHAAQNFLLTFTKVRNEVGKNNDVFNQATQAAVDLSVRGFGSMDSTSKMLGKALQDPVKGINAMSRAGVTFTASQKETIKSLVESGDLLTAQKMILKEVNNQVGGSADAYGKTLPGAIDRLKRGFEAVAFSITTALAPALTTAIDWALVNMPKFQAAVTDALAVAQPYIKAFGTVIQQVFSGTGESGNKVRGIMASLRSTMITLGPAFQTIAQIAAKLAPVLAGVLAASFAMVSKVAAAMAPIVTDAIEKLGPPLARIIVSLLKFQAAVLSVMAKVIPPIIRALQPVFSAVFSAIGQVLNGIASLLEGDFSGAWQAAVKAAEIWFVKLPNIVMGILGQLASVAVSKAIQVGSDIVQGIVDGIGSLGNAIKDKLTGLVDDALESVKSKFKISSPSRVWADEVGNPIGQGIIVGFLTGGRDLPNKVSETVRSALDRARGAVASKQTALQSVFQRMAQGIMRAFDSETSAGVKRIQDRLSAAQASVSVDIDTRMATRQTQGAALTPAEAELQRERDAYDAKERERDKADAQAALAAAEAEDDARAIADARKRLDDIAYADRIRALEKQAADERAIKDAATATDLATLETERTNRLAALQKQYDDEQLQYDSAREVMRQKREDELARLSKFLENSTGKVKTETNKLQAYLNRPDIKKLMEQSGTNLGTAFADALAATKGKVTAAVKTLAKIVQDYLRLRSPSKLGPLSTLNKWWTPMPGTLLKGVDASMIGQVAAGISAPDSGASFGAAFGASSGAAPVVINVTVQGTVTSERELVDTIRTELLKTGQRNGSIFGSYA